MKNHLNFSATDNLEPSTQAQQNQGWHYFAEILRRLHTEGLYIHPDQLAEFMLAHGLPVDLRYVPKHLLSKAIAINNNYQGDMATVIEELEDSSHQFPWLV